MTDVDARSTWHPRNCPMATDADCRNGPARCLECIWPPEAIAPTQYLPRHAAHPHPVVQAAKNARRRARQTAKRTDAARRGRANRRKGHRVERDFAKLSGGTRVPLSGALRGSLTNDVALPDGLRVEVKARKDGAGFKQILTWLLDPVEKPDALVLKADNQPYLVVMEYSRWAADRQPAAVDISKVVEARRLLNDALREIGE